MHLFLTRGFVLRVPLRRGQSLRKKLRARGQLSEFWKSQNLDMIQFTESCTMDQSVNEPLVNYLDVRPPGAKAGRGEGDSTWHGEWAAALRQCGFLLWDDPYGLMPGSPWTWLNKPQGT